MKSKKTIIAFLLLLVSTISIGQKKNWDYSFQFSIGASNAIFSRDNAILHEKMSQSSSIGFSQSAKVLLGYFINEKIKINGGVGYKSLSYKNDSLTIGSISMVKNRAIGLEFPLLFEYTISENGWCLGLGGMYFLGLQNLISYQLENNNQRQQWTENSNLQGFGGQFQIGKQSKPNEKNVLSVYCLGQYYPNVNEKNAASFGFWEASIGLGITF